MASSQYCRAGPVIFTLVPLNMNSLEALEDFRNRRFCERPGQETLPDEIYITFNPHRPEGIYPSTIGRAGDIRLPRTFPASIQCAFEIHKDTGEVMLVDKSPDQSCYVRYSTNTDEILDFTDFGAMVICPHAHEIILHFGEGESDSWMLWAINWWHMPGPVDMEAWAAQVGFHARIGQNMTLQSIPPTRRLDFDGANRENRYLPRDNIKRKPGTIVTKGIDALTGHLVAIKTVKDRKPGRYRLEGEAIKELSTDLNHSHVMEFLQVEIKTDHFELVMELQDGNVYELARNEKFADARNLFQFGDNVGRPLMHQMLQALDYLCWKDITHRDVKPSNILYRRIDKHTYHYRLTDFGMATTAPHPRRGDGDSMFMPPEVLYLDGDHTTKIDIWSLCVSFCCIFGFKLTLSDKFEVYDKHGRVHPDWIPVLETMVVVDSNNRVSAGDVLTEMFEGVGRVTAE